MAQMVTTDDGRQTTKNLLEALGILVGDAVGGAPSIRILGMSFRLERRFWHLTSSRLI